VPRTLAVARFPSLTDALALGVDQPPAVEVDGPVATLSISDPQATAMSLHAVRASDGDAVTCDDEQATAAWHQLAARGLLVELSSAAVLHGAAALAERGAIDGGSTVVLLATAGPYAQRTLDSGPAGTFLDDPSDPAALESAVGDSSAVWRDP
jgi:threonine synthase